MTTVIKPYHFTKELLTQERVEYKLSYNQIAKKYNTTKESVKYYATKFGLTKDMKVYDKEHMIGKQYGNLIIVDLSDIRSSFGRRKWKCKCIQCGKISYCTTINFQQITKTGCNSCSKSGSNCANWSGYGEISGDYWTTIKNGAIKRNYDFEVTIQQAWELFLKQNRKCALSGMKLKLCNMKTDNQTASLDRIDNDKGYTIDNIQWVHKHINFMKRHHNQEYFKYLCANVSNSQKTSNNIEIFSDLMLGG